MKVIDPVCKMTIDSEKAAATSEYKGQTIYFCAKGCVPVIGHYFLLTN